MTPPRNKAPNVTHLRAAIDRGAAGDKTPAGDPAAAPLGTDDEAAGLPPTVSQVRRSMVREVEGRDPDRDANAAATIRTTASAEPPAGAGSRRTRFAPWLVLAGGLAVVMLVFFAMT